MSKEEIRTNPLIGRKTAQALGWYQNIKRCLILFLAAFILLKYRYCEKNASERVTISYRQSE